VTRFNGFARGGVDEDFRRGETRSRSRSRAGAETITPSGLIVPSGGPGILLCDDPAAGDVGYQGGPAWTRRAEYWGRMAIRSRGCMRVATQVQRRTGTGYISGGMTFRPIITFSYLAAHERELIERTGTCD